MEGRPGRRRKDVQQRQDLRGKESRLSVEWSTYIARNAARSGLLRGASVLNLPRRGSQDPVYLAEREGRERTLGGGCLGSPGGRGRRCKASGGTMYDGIEMRLSR